MNHSENYNRRGLTVLELLITLTIFALVIVLGVPGFKSFFKEVEINKGLRTVTIALNCARYKAVEKNRSIKLTIEDNHLILLEKRNDNWEPFMNFDPGEKVTLSMNTSPVFFPEGYIVPLCSIYVKSDTDSYKVTVSIAGRIKVAEL